MNILMFCILMINILSYHTVEAEKDSVIDYNVKNTYPSSLFEKTLKSAKEDIDIILSKPLLTPIPKDFAGGFTHEVHKQNYLNLQLIGNLYTITKDEKYAQYIKQALYAYANLYPTLHRHPAGNSYAKGKLFWQCLNDANWLVYVSQAYESVYEYLSEEETEYLNATLFKPYADFISVENPQFFNRIHNHSTWACAAVGMIGLVMHDKDLVNRALYGIQNDGIDKEHKDNDGGFIKINNISRAGFLAQLDFSFSPDGFFAEGPYYLRYAIYPFLLFARELQEKKKEIKIFEYRNGILLKAIDALLQQTDFKGRFFPINDAQKGMSWHSRELIAAINIGYYYGNQNRMWLDIANQQGKVLLDDTGRRISEDISSGLSIPFKHKSESYKDGTDGSNGGIAILRTSAGNLPLTALFKYSSQGMGHGHFDRLSYSLYDDQNEVLQDYGSVRWVNIDQKGGGRYLPENNSFAKQTIAHNTVVLNETSHFEGRVEKGEEGKSIPWFFENLPEIKVASAIDTQAYHGTTLHRILLLIETKKTKNPLVLDIFKVNAAIESKIDFPYWFMGHVMETNVSFENNHSRLWPLGKSNGYQHVWEEAKGKANDELFKLSWFGNGRFYTMYSFVDVEDEIIFGRSGANDPSFNLRHDPVAIIRKNNTCDATFINVIEAHGEYNPVEEIPNQPYGNIESIKEIYNNNEYINLEISTKEGVKLRVFIAWKDQSKTRKHSLKIDGLVKTWDGFYNIEII